MNDWYNWSKFRFKDTVKVFASSNTYQTITIGQFGEYTNIVRILKLATICHDDYYFI